MPTKFRPLLVASALLTIAACTEKPQVIENKSAAEVAQEEAASQVDHNAPRPFFCLLGAKMFGDDTDRSPLGPVKAYRDYYASRLTEVLGNEDREIWMPHWKSVRLSKNNIDDQVDANVDEYAKLDGGDKRAKMVTFVHSCIKPALLDGIGPKDAIETARAQEAKWDKDYQEMLKANSAK